jgi:hypothetical protein
VHLLVCDDRCYFRVFEWQTVWLVGRVTLVTDSSTAVEFVWNLIAHGDAREGNWRGKWRMEWVASTLTLPRNVLYPALLPLMRTPRLPVVERTDVPSDLNGLVRFGERRILVSARVPSRFKRSLPLTIDGAAWTLTADWEAESVEAVDAGSADK